MPCLRIHLVSPLILGCATLFLPPGAQAAPQLLHSEPSQFGKVLVFEENGERCMNFNTMVDLGRQTCLDIAKPDNLVFSYTRMMISSLYVKPDPKTVLIVGLGGATLQKTLAKLLPDAVIDTVEIDPAVGKVAEKYFGYRPGPRQRLFVEDGRAYIERAHREGRQYDMVMLDAFDVDYIPEHLMTLEFLQHVKAILAPGGIVVANTFTNSELYERESATYAAVFGQFFNLREGNRVIVAGRGTLPDEKTIADNANKLAQRLERLGIDQDRALQRFTRTENATTAAKVLQD
ncbi:spermidine synthase [Bordetella sp. BOR01]|uniref:spermidine synthase n=1 Tax=Bordetella sp. BOR01 TaxID=2854779 RepID=UPI002104DCA3|nr:fused MFS/spermidine synthase [Bordetella sp. BOR01]